jgi:hypothetical protein
MTLKNFINAIKNLKNENYFVEFSLEYLMTSGTMHAYLHGPIPDIPLYMSHLHKEIALKN